LGWGWVGYQNQVKGVVEQTFGFSLKKIEKKEYKIGLSFKEADFVWSFPFDYLEEEMQ